MVEGVLSSPQPYKGGKMSYVSTLEDVKELFDEFFEIAKKLSDELDDMENLSTISDEDIRLCRYLSSKLDLDRYELEVRLQELLKNKEEK